MTGNLYAMITTRSSNRYTDIALDTFFRSTKLTNKDEFVLIDNDAEGTYTNVNIISNINPKSFAANCNALIDYAQGRRLFLLSNDVVFTPGWCEPLAQFSNALTLPSCNQTHVYSFNDLTIRSSMNIEEYGGKFKELSKIADLHKSQTQPGFFERLLMGFYVFMLPANVYNRVGYFDDTFGVGGGEDVDYRLRAIQLGIPVKYISQSYLLHFAGKSTWDGPEQQSEIEHRNKLYFSKFAEKWGDDLADLCLVGGNTARVVEKYQLYPYLEKQNYTASIKAVLNNQHRT